MWITACFSEVKYIFLKLFISTVPKVCITNFENNKELTFHMYVMSSTYIVKCSFILVLLVKDNLNLLIN